VSQSVTTTQKLYCKHTIEYRSHFRKQCSDYYYYYY